MENAGFWIIVFVVSLAALLKSSDLFVKASEKIGVSFGLSPFVVGALILALGTSLPELVSGVIAVFNDVPEVLIGNVIGSNITNIFFVLGFVALVSKKIQLNYDIIKIDLPLMVGSAVLLAFAFHDGVFQLYESIFFIIALGVYLHYVITQRNVAEVLELSAEERKKIASRKSFSNNWKQYALLIISGVGIYFSADFNIQSIIKLSEIYNIGGEFIALTFVALGTSLPELIVCMVAIFRGNPEMAIGNIVGSNIFNTFAVMGIPGLFGAIIIPETILTFSLPLMIAATLLFFFMIQDKLISRWEGALLLILYIFYIVQLFLML
ncbi:MAG: sodium:calcium antiporter [Chitinophagaceae bacterium]|nr:MAG: sodium:calcium antiporter [Chitinophagaceae bacterium]